MPMIHNHAHKHRGRFAASWSVAYGRFSPLSGACSLQRVCVKVCAASQAPDLAEGGNLMVSASLLTATLAIGGLQAAGYGSNHQDLSPKYSGILFGLTNASASSAGAAAVFTTGAVCTGFRVSFQSSSVMLCHLLHHMHILIYY